MRTILLIGAGKSTSYLIEYFLEKAEKENLFLRIGDSTLLMLINYFKITLEQKLLNLIYKMTKHARKPLPLVILLFQCYLLQCILQ